MVDSWKLNSLAITAGAPKFVTLNPCDKTEPKFLLRFEGAPPILHHTLKILPLMVHPAPQRIFCCQVYSAVRHGFY